MPTLPLVRSTRFGDIEAAEKDRFRLLRPLAGFPSTRFLVKVSLPRQRPFFWLQSLEEDAVAFAVAPADLLRPGYGVALEPWDREVWGAADTAEVLALLSFRGGPTANLAAPVILDPQRRVALQIVNQSGVWGLNEPLARP